MRRCAFVLLGCLIISPVRAQIGVALQGQLGGDSRTIAVSESGEFACLGVGPRVVLLELSSSGESREAGWSEILPEIVEDIVIQGAYAFVADGLAGLYIFDISDPVAPKVVGHYETPDEHTWDRGLHVCLSGQLAYFADGPGGLYILDISNPADPVCVAAVEEIRAYAVATADGYAYVASATNGLIIVDVSDPTHPQTAAQLDLSCEILDVEISGGYAYLAGNRIALDSFQGLCVIDVRDPRQPLLVGSCDVDNPGELVVTGKIAYVTKGLTGVDFIRITNPALPARVGGYESLGFAKSVAVTPGYLYLAAQYTGLEVVDVSTITRPALVGTYRTTDVAEVAVSGAYAYVVHSLTGLQTINVSNPQSPKWVSWLDLECATCVSLGKGCLWVGDGMKLTMIDISNPANPQVTGSCNVGGSIMGIVVEGQYAYTVGGSGLTILDLSIPHQPTIFGQSDVTTSGQSLCVSGHYAYIVGLEGLDIIDLSDRAAPVPMGHYQEPGNWPRGIGVSGNYAYLASGNPGMQVLDISDPWLPGRVRTFDTPYSQGIVIEGPYAYLTDLRSGLYILDISSPSEITCVGRHSGVGYNKLVVAGDYVYTADWHKGLSILEMGDSDDSESDQNTDTRVR